MTGASPFLEKLTKREAEVARLIIAGFPCPAIAERLRVSHNTVVTHKRQVLYKLGVRCRYEVAERYAQYLKVLGLPPEPLAQGADGELDAEAPPMMFAARLTPRQVELIPHFCGPLRYEDLAGRLFLSVDTVRSHAKNILRVLGAKRRHEIAARYTQYRQWAEANNVPVLAKAQAA